VIQALLRGGFEVPRRDAALMHINTIWVFMCMSEARGTAGVA